MRKERFLFVLLTIFALSLFWSATASAARRDALQNSELIRDTDDVFTYPQLVLEYDNHLGFEYGAGTQVPRGNALMILGNDSFAAGLAVHRGDLFEMSGYRTSGSGFPGTLTPSSFDLSPARSFPYDFPADYEVSDPQAPLSAAGVSDANGNLVPHTLFDVLGGFDLGSGMAGARLSLGVGGASVDPADGESSSKGQLFFLFKGGYSGEFDSFNLDTSLTFLFDTADDNDLAAAEDTQVGSVTGLALEGRFYNEMTDTSSLGGLLDIGFSSLSITQEQPDPTETRTMTNFLIQAGFGPVFHVGGTEEGTQKQALRLAQFGGTDDEDTGTTGGPDAGTTGTPAPEMEEEEDETATDATEPLPTPTGEESSTTTESTTTTSPSTSTTTTTQEKTTAAPPPPPPPPAPKKKAEKPAFEQSAEIAGYGVLGFTSLSGDPNDEDEDDEGSASGIIIPGFHLAGEFHILKWLYFRSGAQYWFMHFNATQATADGDSKQGFDNHGFGWSAGVGFEVGQFRFDGSFNRGFLRAGPQFLGGTGNGLFGTASAEFTW